MILLDTPGSAWRGGRILSDTIEPMPTNGVNETGDRRDLHALAAELVQRAKTHVPEPHRSGAFAGIRTRGLRIGRVVDTVECGFYLGLWLQSIILQLPLLLWLTPVRFMTPVTRAVRRSIHGSIAASHIYGHLGGGGIARGFLGRHRMRSWLPTVSRAGARPLGRFVRVRSGGPASGGDACRRAVDAVEFHGCLSSSRRWS